MDTFLGQMLPKLGVVGKPFIADFSQTHANSVQKYSSFKGKGKLYRSNEGKIRRDIFSSSNENEIIESTIVDHIVNFWFSIDLVKKQIVKLKIPDWVKSKPFGKDLLVEMQNAEVHNELCEAMLKTKLTSFEDFSSVKINNLLCSGIRLVGGKNSFECWYSELLDEVVMAKFVIEENEDVFNLCNIQLIEPYKDYFVVPQNYEMLDYSMH